MLFLEIYAKNKRPAEAAQYHLVYVHYGIEKGNGPAKIDVVSCECAFEIGFVHSHVDSYNSR